jgi:hypothetical protein
MRITSVGSGFLHRNLLENRKGENVAVIRKKVNHMELICAMSVRAVSMAPGE